MNATTVVAALASGLYVCNIKTTRTDEFLQTMFMDVCEFHVLCIICSTVERFSICSHFAPFLLNYFHNRNLFIF